MTEEELMQKFSDIFQNAFPASEIEKYYKIFGTDRQLAIRLTNGEWLYFTWYEPLYELSGKGWNWTGFK